MISSNPHSSKREWKIGERVALVKTIRQSDLTEYDRLMRSEQHGSSDEDFTNQPDRQVIPVPPMFLGGLIGAAIQQYFCEVGSVCLNHYLEFIAPAYAGDTVTAALEVDHLQPDRSIVRLKTACTNQSGQALVTGQAVILMHKEVNSD